MAAAEEAGDLLSLERETEATMNNFISRLARAQHLSGKKAPSLEVLMGRYIFQSALAARVAHRTHYTNALHCLRVFTESAEQYRREALAIGPKRSWNGYEDQRLRKPISKLKRLLVEHERRDALRRLRSKGSVSETGVV